MTHQAFISIYIGALKEGSVLICEKDDTYYPPVYKVSICFSDIKDKVYNGIILFKTAEDIKDCVMKTWTLQSGKEPYLSYVKPITEYVVREVPGIGYINPTAIKSIIS